MIEENVKLHDKFSVELKVGFVAKKKKKINDFAMNIWIFIPFSLDINRFTYSKTDFYRDIKTHIRLITPVFLLRDIAEGENSPFLYLRKSFSGMASQPTRTNREEYEYQIKMFIAILKSSLREAVAHIFRAKEGDIDYLVNDYIRQIFSIAGQYRSLYRIINVPTVQQPLMELFNFGDEFMSNIIELHTFRLMQGIKKRFPGQRPAYAQQLAALVQEETDYKRAKGFPIVDKSNKKNNNDLVYRLGMLKKYAESHLYLNIDRRKDGVWAEQLFFSLAAGISMVFATVVAFSVQQKFGNMTMPLFVALVVSYMLKDRIKEFARYYFAHQLGSRYFDHNIRIRFNQQMMGWVKESIGFVSGNKVPGDILKARGRSSIFEAYNRTNNEKVLLYRTKMRLDRRKLNEMSNYPVDGVVSIIRLNVLQFIRNMDNPDFPLFCQNDDHDFQQIQAEKLYYLHLILHKTNDAQNELVRYRIALNRLGIYKIEKTDPHG